jgi:hypothetical protein
MASGKPLFSVRANGAQGGYVIDAVWPNGEAEQLVGIYRSTEDAARWVNERSDAWVRERMKPTPV